MQDFKWHYSTSKEPYNIAVVASDAAVAIKVVDFEKIFFLKKSMLLSEIIELLNWR